MKTRSTDRYVEATHLVPKGETRTFAELAALAGKPGAARAAGRAIAACDLADPHPWHRIVASDGALASDPARAKEQLRRLVAEGALPAGARKANARKVRGSSGRAAAAATAVARGAGRARVRGRTTAETSAPNRASGPKTVGGPKKEGAARALHTSIKQRLASLDWARAVEELRSTGFFHAPALLAPAECGALVDAFDDDARFERTIRMGPRGYGVGTYRYWKDPLPEPAESVRAELYGRLRELASEAAGASAYPPSFEAFRRACRESGQARASSILLRYPEGGVNFPHRDVYGPTWFPYQAVCVLSERGEDFEGGEFLLIEEAAGRPARERVHALDAGDLAIFASRGYRSPEHGTRHAASSGRFVELRHGMRTVTRGERFALGLVLHLAE